VFYALGGVAIMALLRRRPTAGALR
jgi:hypothetical protein